MGAKGSKVQKITTDFNVQIKFPDKAVENGNGEAAVNGDRLVSNSSVVFRCQINTEIREFPNQSSLVLSMSFL